MLPEGTPRTATASLKLIGIYLSADVWARPTRSPRVIMKILVRLLAVAWALVSVGLGVLAFAVVTGTGGSFAQAAYEAVEAIPEAIMQRMGFDGAAVWVVVVGYWLVLTAAVLFAFKRK